MSFVKTSRIDSISMDCACDILRMHHGLAQFEFSGVTVLIIFDRTIESFRSTNFDVTCGWFVFELEVNIV